MRAGKDKECDRLEEELKKVEIEVRRYLEEKETEKQRQEQRERRKAKKWEKEKHWEMMRWITKYIEENKISWEEREEMRKKTEP